MQWPGKKKFPKKQAHRRSRNFHELWTAVIVGVLLAAVVALAFCFNYKHN
jgi:hypothetical protein